MSSMTTWFPTSSAASGERLALFCFPHGGGGVSSFRDWQSAIGDQIDVVPVSLPGRERRIAEPLIPSIGALADALVQPALMRAGGACALFGHSMGALLAFELARRLTAAGRPPALLAVSGSSAPQAITYTSRWSELTDEEFLDSVNSLGGVPDGLLDIPELREVILPVLRADYQACATYQYLPGPVLDIPVLVFGGQQDPYAPPPALEGWRDVTSGPGTIRIFSGGHFYITDHLAEVIATIRAAVVPVFGAPEISRGR
jgi:surfactin synthase thioesterase subunit